MQTASDASVLGNFARVTFRDQSFTATFFRDHDKFMVYAAGRDGVAHDYEIKYTLGVFPLQQYLIQLPGGRLQAFGIAWDSRPRAAGGQRWFALYPGTGLEPASPLYWTAPDQTWNYMCADCHSTNVRKNYYSATRSYATTYAEIDVGCEACHGPGAAHVAWAKKPAARRKADPAKSLTIALDERAGVSWNIDSRTGEVKRNRAPGSHREVQMCARCHSRRAPIDEDYVHGQPLGDDYRAALLDAGLYFADGQIEGEVYEYGSFLQSRMFHAGVTCSDCHDPHSADVRAAGNNLCTRCHSATAYDTPRHHFHPAGSAAAQCVACHMPTRTYMLIDQRRDHSLRVPRPDLSVTLGTPNACNNCHTDKTPQWAASYVTKWYGPTRVGFQRFADALAAGRLGAPGAGRALTRLVSDRAQPAIARATALEMLAVQDNAVGGDVLARGAVDESALVRRAVATALANRTANEAIMLKLLEDPVRTVRIEAAQSLAGIPRDGLSAELRAALDRACMEYLAALRLNADRPEAHLDLATFFARQGDLAQAQTELQTALAIDPSFGPAAVNLADLYRQSGRDDKAEIVLRQAMEHAPADAALRYSLGLLEIREKHIPQALDLLAAAARLEPSNPQYAYVYAIALSDSADADAAIGVLERSVKLNPYHRASLIALVALCNRAGARDKARRYARMLEELTTQESRGE